MAARHESRAHGPRRHRRCPGERSATSADRRRVPKAIGTGKNAPKSNGVDVLGWDFAFEMNEIARQQAAAAGFDMRFIRIPREVLEKRAVEQGDIQFFELAALSVDVKPNKRDVFAHAHRFRDPARRRAGGGAARRSSTGRSGSTTGRSIGTTRDDTFHNEWQSYRTRKDRIAPAEVTHPYAEPGDYTVVVKVIDILGNDTTKTVEVEVA